MNRLVTFLKKREDLFDCIEYNPENPREYEFLYDFSKLGALIDITEDSIVQLSVGDYEKVKKKAKDLSEKFTSSGNFKFVDNLWLYNLSSVSATDIYHILPNSGYINKILKEYTELPKINCSDLIFDTYEEVK